MAVAGFILSLIAVFSTIIGVTSAGSSPGAGAVLLIAAIIVAVIGFILSLVATIRRSTTKRGLAITGLVLSTLLMIVLLILIFGLAYVSGTTTMRMKY